MTAKDFTHDDTIAAIATPAGQGGIAVIRISGGDSLGVLGHIFKTSAGKSAADMDSHRLYHGRVIDYASGGTLDMALAVVMKSPRSYTGEDTAEIHSHGGYLLPGKILELCFKNGARPARPGEFTLRAFLNGRMDLAQAEAVAELVSAETTECLRVAEQQPEGALSSIINGFQNSVLEALAEVEARVDFPEEDIDPLIKERIFESVAALIEEISKLISTFDEGRVLKHGVYTAIIGKPNVGKSSILNRLVMKDRAIVSPHPGTTRDFIEEAISVGGIPIRLIDTAGLRSARDEVEHAGVEMTRKKAREAELIIAVFDGSCELDEDDSKVMGDIDRSKTVIVINKSDLVQRLSSEDLAFVRGVKQVVKTSAKTGAGIEDLKMALQETVLGSERSSEGAKFVISELRHKRALERTSESLKGFLSALQAEQSPEFLAFDLRHALDSLGEITGETTTEEILGRIFSKFCVGK